MQLTYSDGGFISDLSDVTTEREIGGAPVEFSGTVSDEGARQLNERVAAFYRATAADARYTLTIDKVKGLRIAGTIRRR